MISGYLELITEKKLQVIERSGGGCTEQRLKRLSNLKKNKNKKFLKIYNVVCQKLRSEI